MTLEEWGDLPEDEEGELVDGVLVEEEEVGYLHDSVGAWLVVLLGGWLYPRNGRLAMSDPRFAVAPRRGRKPDISAYFAGSTPPPAEGLIRVPPDIVVEIVSRRPRDARRDRIEKWDEYAHFGIRYYWIVDPALRSLEIHELQSDGRYARALGASETIVTTVPGCEGLTIDLPALWAEIDRQFPPA